MNPDQEMPTSNFSEDVDAPTPRLWQRPQVIRLQAGHAEAGFRLVQVDGPLGKSFS